MKLRFSVVLKILLPYLVLLLLFFLLFLGVQQSDQQWLAALSLAGMVLSPLFAIIHLYWLKKPLGRVSKLIAQLTRGVFPEFRVRQSADEIGELEKNLGKHVSNLKEMAAFSRSMARGDFSGQYDRLSSEDELGEALNLLKVSLMGSMKESEERQREEEIQTWSAQGLAKFSTLFREAEDNLDELSSRLMKELVYYTEADAGTLFISRDEPGEAGPFLEDSGTYAFDRHKEIRRTFKFGEGLVGRAALEKELIYVSDLPPDYIKIRSGLGEDKPSSILLVPVLLDQQVLGVLELASLGEIPSHQIEFIRLLADALATTLAKVKANLQNRRLFEQTKKQAEELSSQEKVFKEKLVQLEIALERSVATEAELRKDLEQLRKEGR